MVLSGFPWPRRPVIQLLRRDGCSGACKLLSWVIWVFFHLSYMSSLYFWVIKLFITYMVCKCFFTSYRFYFHFVNGFCCSAGACSCDVGPLVYFLSSSLCFRYYIQKIITKTHSKNLIPVFSSKECHGLDLPVKPLSIFFSTSIKKKCHWDLCRDCTRSTDGFGW